MLEFQKNWKVVSEHYRDKEEATPHPKLSKAMEELWKKVVEIRRKISNPKIGRMIIENGWKSENLRWEY